MHRNFKLIALTAFGAVIAVMAADIPRKGIPAIIFGVLVWIVLELSCAGVLWLVAFFCGQQEARISFAGAWGVTILISTFGIASDGLRLTFIRALFTGVLFWVILTTVVFFVMSRVDKLRSAPNKSPQPIPMSSIGTLGSSTSEGGFRANTRGRAGFAPGTASGQKLWRLAFVDEYRV